MITFLSPHLDDVAFSLGVTLSIAARNGHALRMVNCFTQSVHAPLADASGSEAVSQLRAQEDQAFVAGLGGSVESLDLGVPDTSLRQGYKTIADSFHRRPFGADESRIANDLAARFEALTPSSLVLLPMAYGHHVDHRLVRAAAERVFEPATRVYYEELPYSLKAPRRMLRKQVADDRFQPRLIPADERAYRDKRAAITCFRSQLDPAQAEAFMSRARKLGGERVWSLTPSLDELGLVPS